jgi:hypothetical protein
MFDALFTTLGSLGSMLLLLGIVAVLFLVAAGETLRLAQPELRARWVAVTTAWGAAPSSIRRIARALAPGDSQSRHAHSLRDFVDRFRLRNRG